jgi:uncharacterized protein YjbI with pentapeptide repeats
MTSFARSSDVDTEKPLSRRDLEQLIRANENSARGLSLLGRCLCGINLAEPSPLNLDGVDLRKANLQGADLRRVSLKDAKLSGAKLENANLRWAVLKRAELKNTNFSNADLSYANFQEADLTDADLTNARLFGACLGHAYLAHARLRDCIGLTRDHLRKSVGEEKAGDYASAKEVYLQLKNYFLSVGRYDDAGWAYVKERRMERATYWPFRAKVIYREEFAEDPNLRSKKFFGLIYRLSMMLRRIILYLKYSWFWALSFFYDLLCEYGESTLRIVVSSLVIILLYAAIYYYSGALEFVGEQANALGLRGEVTDPLVSLYFSFLAFNSVIFGGVLPKLEPRAQLLVGSEAFVGVFMAALFVFVMGRKIGGR